MFLSLQEATSPDFTLMWDKHVQKDLSILTIEKQLDSVFTCMNIFLLNGLSEVYSTAPDRIEN